MWRKYTMKYYLRNRIDSKPQNPHPISSIYKWTLTIREETEIDVFKEF